VPAVTALLLVVLGLYAIIGRPASVSAAITKHQNMQQSEVPSPEDAAESCCGAEESATD
jgi:hypothetical protein